MPWNDQADANLERGKALLASPKSVSEGVLLIQTAAVSGYPPAMAFLGKMHSESIGVEFSETQALHWSSRAAEAGNPRGKYQLATHLEYGWGIDPDAQRAFALYLEAASEGVTVAASSVALAYKHGEGVEQDLALALKWFLVGAKSGDAFAQRMAAMVLRGRDSQDGTSQQAWHWLEQSAKQGDCYALFELGCYCLAGYGCERNPFRAEIFFRRAGVYGGSQNSVGQWVTVLHGRVEHEPGVSSAGFTKIADTACSDVYDVHRLIDHVVKWMKRDP